MMTNLPMTDLTDGHQPDRYKTVFRKPPNRVQRHTAEKRKRPTLWESPRRSSPPNGTERDGAASTTPKPQNQPSCLPVRFACLYPSQPASQPASPLHIKNVHH